LYVDSMFLYISGMMGYACTDDRFRHTYSDELLAVLLLTLSNMFFIPSTVLAVYRRYYVEAAIYLITMFMSTVS